MNGLRSFWSRVHPYIRKRTILALLIVAGAVALYIAIISMVPEPRTWVTVKATSEYIGFRAANSDLATMRVRGMVARSTSPDDKLEGCVDAIVSPAQGAWVEYRRGGPEYLRIVIDPPANGKIAMGLANQTSFLRPIFDHGRERRTWDRRVGKGHQHPGLVEVGRDDAGACKAVVEARLLLRQNRRAVSRRRKRSAADPVQHLRRILAQSGVAFDDGPARPVRPC